MALTTLASTVVAPKKTSMFLSHETMFQNMENSIKFLNRENSQWWGSRKLDSLFFHQTPVHRGCRVPEPGCRFLMVLRGPKLSTRGSCPSQQARWGLLEPSSLINASWIQQIVLGREARAGRGFISIHRVEGMPSQLKILCLIQPSWFYSYLRSALHLKRG